MTNSAPLGRVVGRWITHVCVWIETLSFDVRDSMCGLRVYPMAAIAALLDRGGRIGQGMDFDIEILVRLHRAGTPVVNHPVSVTYPPGNLSNFRMWRDNWHITKMHTRLIAGTLVSLPVVLWRRSRRAGTATHWAGLGERGMYWGLQGSAWAYRLLGRRGCMAMLAPVVLYFYLTAGERRRASLDFLRRAFAASGRARPPGWWDGYRHFLSFARRALDSFVAWMGRMPADAVRPMEVAALEEAKAQPRGAMFIVSHHGNVEVSRALLDRRNSPARRRPHAHAACGELQSHPARIQSGSRRQHACRSPRWGRTRRSRCSSGSTAATGCSLPAIARRSAETGGPASRRFSARTPNSPRGPI